MFFKMALHLSYKYNVGHIEYLNARMLGSHLSRFRVRSRVSRNFCGRTIQVFCQKSLSKKKNYNPKLKKKKHEIGVIFIFFY